MDERISRVLEKMKEKGIDQLLVSDPLSIRFLTGIMVNPGERLYALLLRTSGKHTLFLNYLYYVSNTGFEEVWFSDMDDQIGVLTRQNFIYSLKQNHPLSLNEKFQKNKLIRFHRTKVNLISLFFYNLMSQLIDLTPT